MTGPSSPLPWLPLTSTCASLIRALDWGRTPAGPIERWPAHLRTAVSVALNSGFPMGVLWGKERVQIYNDAYMPIFGRKHPESMGARARESWGELWTEIDPMFTAVEQTGRATFLVDQLLPIDKRGRIEECYFTFSYSPLFGDSGEVDGIFVSALETTRDVTARREAQANELRLTEILEATTDLVGTAAPDGTVLYVNRAGRAMVGLPADGPLPPANLLDFSPDEEGEGVRAAVDVARAEGTWSGERLLRRRGGEVFPVSQVILTHRNPEGEVSFFSTVARDITAQRRAEQTLRAAHALTSALIQTAPVAIITCDADLTVTGWNPAAERLFGWRTDEVVGRPFPVESPDGDVLAELREVISEGRTLQGREVHRLHRSGTPLDVLISTALLRDPKGEISRRVAFILDVTERKRLEQQFLQSQKMEAVGQLAGGVAHDFNNLLAVISSNLQMALDELPRDTEVYEAVRDAHQGASRAISLTRQLLAFSRSQVLELEPLDLSAVVADAERMLRRLVREDIRFDTQLGQGLPPVRADRGQLEQVLVNLVVNARDAMPRGGNLTLRTARVDLEEGPFLELTVQDTGVGMGEHTRAHLFEPFFTTKPVGKGTGLGLATVYGIVRQLEGRIDVESREGEGATFRVRIPITEPDGSPPSPSREGAPEAEVTGGDECILVVEDEPLVRSAIRRTLERYGYRVVEAEDGLDALEVHARERNQIALVLTDLVMPRLGGRALAERLEQAGARVPILFMSGYDREGAATAEAGTAVDLPKPFQTTALLRAIRQRLDG